MKIGIASDHGGFKLKEELIKFLESKNYEIADYGAYSEEPSDYPIYTIKLAESIRDQQNQYGIVICRSGEGACIAANKVKGIRCAKPENKETTIKTREHNDSNMISLSGDYMTKEEAKEIIQAFLTTPFSNEERHIRRIKQITDYEDKNYA